MAIGLGQLDEVGQRIHVAVRVAAFVDQLLPLPHHAEVAVVQRDDLDRRAVLLAGRELLDVHLDRALAGDAEHVRVRLGQLDAHRIRQAHAHRAQAAGVDPAPRLVEAVELRRPHLVLADVRGHVAVGAARQVPQRLDDMLRLDQLVRQLVAQAVALAPFGDLRPPGAERVGIRSLLGLADLRDQLLQHVLDIAHDRDVDLDALGDRRRIDVDMDDLALDRGEMLRVADHAVIEARAHRQQDVAVLHRHVGFIGAVHPEHAQEARVGGRHRAQAHQRVRDRVAQQVDQLAQLGRGIAQHHAAAGVDVGPLGLQQQRHRLADLAAMALAHRVVRAHRDRLGILEGRGVQRHVLRNVDDDRARSAGAGDVEGLLQRDGQVAHVLDQEVVLDDRAGDADGVALLEGIEADRGGRHLAGDHHHRDRVHVGGGDAGDRIGHAGAGGDQGHADIAGGTRIAVGRMDRRLFVADQDVLDRLLLVQRVVDVQDRAAGIAPDELDAFGLKAAHEDFRAVEHRQGSRRGRGIAGGLCRCGTLLFRGRHVHVDEPFGFSLTKIDRCASSRPREAELAPARSSTQAPGVGRPVQTRHAWCESGIIAPSWRHVEELRTAPWCTPGSRAGRQR